MISEIGDLLRSVACACLFPRGGELESLPPLLKRIAQTTVDSSQRSRRISDLSRVFFEIVPATRCAIFSVDDDVYVKLARNY